MNKTDYKNLKEIFIKANKEFLKRNKVILNLNLSERTLCGALMYILQLTLENNSLTNYFVDIEYNRVKNGCKKIITFEKLPKSIVCDLIVHSRGKLQENDNLIALEMKKVIVHTKIRKMTKIDLNY